MNRTLIRSYTLGADGDLLVGAFKNGDTTDLSQHYVDIPRDRHMLRADAFIDVFRYADGDLSWSGSSNGHDPENAIAYKLLLDAFTADLRLEGTPRGF